jgi:hypothetical protein
MMRKAAAYVHSSTVSVNHPRTGECAAKLAKV